MSNDISCGIRSRSDYITPLGQPPKSVHSPVYPGINSTQLKRHSSPLGLDQGRCASRSIAGTCCGAFGCRGSQATHYLVSVVRASQPFVKSVDLIRTLSPQESSQQNQDSFNPLVCSSGATTRAVPRLDAKLIHQFMIHQRAQGSSHVHLSIAHENASSKSAIKTTRLFVRHQRARLQLRATMTHSRVSRKLVEHTFTPQHRNTKCLGQATRARGSQQNNRQVVSYRDAFSVALCHHPCPKRATRSASMQQSTKTSTTDVVRLLWP